MHYLHAKKRLKIKCHIFSSCGHFVLKIRLKIYWHVYVDILKALCFHSVITPNCIYTLLNHCFHNIQSACYETEIWWRWILLSSNKKKKRNKNLLHFIWNTVCFPPVSVRGTYQLTDAHYQAQYLSRRRYLNNFFVYTQAIISLSFHQNILNHRYESGWTHAFILVTPCVERPQTKFWHMRTGNDLPILCCRGSVILSKMLKQFLFSYLTRVMTKMTFRCLSLTAEGFRACFMLWDSFSLFICFKEHLCQLQLFFTQWNTVWTTPCFLVFINKVFPSKDFLLTRIYRFLTVLCKLWSRKILVGQHLLNYADLHIRQQPPCSSYLNQ